MGWFSAEEIVAPATNNIGPAGENNHLAQTIALCALVAVVVGLVIKVVAKIQRQHTERVGEQAARRLAAQV